jgi:hypothetical protein
MKSLDEFVVDRAIDYADQKGQQVDDRNRAEEDRASYLERSIASDNKGLLGLLRDQYLNRQDSTSHQVYEEVHEELSNRIRLTKIELDLLSSDLSRRRKDKLILRRVNDLPWHPSQPVTVRRAWIRQYITEIVINPALIRGAKFDSRRIQIEWTMGDYVPNDTDDSLMADQWNEANVVMKSFDEAPR